MLSRFHKCFLYVKPKVADVKPKVADELKTPRIPAVFADGKDIAQQQSHASQSYQLGDASPLQKSLAAFFEKIGLMHTSDFGMGLRSLEKLSEQHGQVSFGTLFAGADIIRHVLDDLSDEHTNQCGETIRFSHEYSCEIDDPTMAFINNEHNAKLHFKDVQELSRSSCIDLKTGKETLVPWVALLLYGFICTSRSGNNCHAKANKGCVQKGESKTGESFHDVEKVITTKRPKLAIGENLTKLTEETPNMQCQSDADYICKWYRAQQYWCEAVQLEAREKGSQASRLRLYFLSISEEVFSVSRRSYVQMLLVGMNLPPFAMEGFLLSDAEIAEMSETATATKRQKCQDGSYADDHSFLYELAKMPWPQQSRNP